MKRTTVLIDEELWAALDRLARSQGLSRSEVLRRAVEAFVTEHLPVRGLPGFVACGSSGYRGSLGADSKKLLKKSTGRRGFRR